MAGYGQELVSRLWAVYLSALGMAHSQNPTQFSTRLRELITMMKAQGYSGEKASGSGMISIALV